MERMDERFVVRANIRLWVVGIFDFIRTVLFNVLNSNGFQAAHYVHAELGVRREKHHSLIPPIFSLIMIVEPLDSLDGLTGINAL